MKTKILNRAEWLYVNWECPIENCPLAKCRKQRCIKRIANELRRATAEIKGGKK